MHVMYIQWFIRIVLTMTSILVSGLDEVQLIQSQKFPQT